MKKVGETRPLGSMDFRTICAERLGPSAVVLFDQELAVQKLVGRHPQVAELHAFQLATCSPSTGFDGSLGVVWLGV